MPKALGPGNNDPARHIPRHNPLSQEGRVAAQPPRIGSDAHGTLFPGERPTLPQVPGMIGGPSAHFPRGNGPDLPPMPAPPNLQHGASPVDQRLRQPGNDSIQDFGPPPPSPRPGFASLPGPSEAPPPSPRPGFATLPGSSTGHAQARPPAFDPVRDSLGLSHPIQSAWPDLPSTPFAAFLPQPPQSFGIAGGGRILPPLDFGPPAPPPNPFMDRVNADWDRNHTDLPPKHTRVGFAGPDGERIPAGAQTPPAQPPPTWNGTRNTELSDMVAANYDTVLFEKCEQRRCFDDIVSNPNSDTATKRRELREELARIDRDPDSQHLGQTAREDLAKLGLSHPHLVDDEWLLPTRPSSPQSPSAG